MKERKSESKPSMTSVSRLTHVIKTNFVDHAALVLKYEPNEVSFLEVTTDQGVIISNWS